MAVAETTKSSGKGSGESRPSRKSKSKTPTCRKARSVLSSGNKWLRVNQGKGYSLPCLQSQFNSALSRKSSEGYAPSQLGSGGEALRCALLHFATCTRPHLFAASPRVLLRAGQVPLPALLTNIRIPSGGLFAPTTRVGATYLIESNPKLTNYKLWLSSDYLLSALSFDPQTTQKRLGDGFYEQRLVRDQISQLTGKRFLDGYSDEEAEYRALMDSAVTASKQFNLRPGIALTAEQAAQLTSDIVWLVETEVTLPNGSKVKALAPQVYLSKLSAKNIRPDGNLIAAAGDIDLKDLKGFTNAGTLTAGGNLALQTNGTLNNAFGTLSSGRMMTLAAGKDIDLTSSTVRASALSLSAGQDIILATATQTTQGTSSAAPQGGAGFGNLLGAAPAGNSFSKTTIGQTASIAVTGDTSITTGRDFNMAGATLATGGNLNVSTGGNWNIGTVQANEAKITNSFGGTQSSNFTTNQGSTITVGGNTKANVGGDLNVSGSTLNLGTNANGTAVIAVTGNVSITAAKDTAKVDSSYNAGKASGTYNTFDETVKGSSLTSNGLLTLTAVKDLTVIGSNIQAAGNTNLGAGGNVTIAAERETHTLDAEDKGSKGGLGGKSETKTTSQNLDIIQSGVSGSNVSIVSKNGNVVLEAAKVEATNNLNVSATNGAVALLSATSQSYYQQDKKESNVAVQRNSGSGNFDKNVITTKLSFGSGGLSINTNKIIADLPASKGVEELAKQPGMAWVAAIQNDPALAGKVDWKKIDEAHKNWSYDKQGLSPAGAAILSIVVAMTTGADISAFVATTGATGATAAALTAGLTSLASTSAISMVNNGGDLGKVFAELGSSANVKGLVTSMLTAGAVNGLATQFPDLTSATASSTFGAQLGKNLINSAAGAVISSAVNGTSLEESLKGAVVSALINTAAAQGANAIGSAAAGDNPQINKFAQMFAHAALGCAVGAAKTSNASGGGGCSAGALGGVVGEIAAQVFDPNGTGGQQTVQIASIAGAVAIALNGGTGTQVNIGISAAANAAENNWLTQKQKEARDAALKNAPKENQKSISDRYAALDTTQDSVTTKLRDAKDVLLQTANSQSTPEEQKAVATEFTKSLNEMMALRNEFAKAGDKQGVDIVDKMLGAAQTQASQAAGMMACRSDEANCLATAQGLQNFALGVGKGILNTPSTLVNIPLQAIDGYGNAVQAVLGKPLTAITPKVPNVSDCEGQVQCAGEFVGNAIGTAGVAKAISKVGGLLDDAAAAEVNAQAAAKAKVENNITRDSPQYNTANSDVVNKPPYQKDGMSAPFAPNTQVEVGTAPAGTIETQVISTGQKSAIENGKNATGRFSTTDNVPDQSYATDNLAITTPKTLPSGSTSTPFKPDVEFTTQVQTTQSTPYFKGTVGSQEGATGGGQQTQWLTPPNSTIKPVEPVPNTIQPLQPKPTTAPEANGVTK